MNWRDTLLAAWRDLPPTLKRLLIALSLAATALILFAFVGPQEMQLLAVLGLVGLFVIVQSVILWRLWQQNPVFRRARQAYLAGDFAEAARLLEAERAENDLPPESQTLLGNAYRQLNRLDESEQMLRTALNADSSTPFAAYGLGRTLLVRGDYADGAAFMQQALDNRAQLLVYADLAYAQVLADQPDAALDSLARLEGLALEPHRALLARYLTWRLQDQPVDTALYTALTRYDHGLDTLRAEAARFSQTPYGKALAQDIIQIEQLLKEGTHEHS